MFAERTSVGLDVHARSVAAAAIDGVTGELVQAKLTPSHEHIRSWLGDLAGPVAVAYEAGPTGFGLSRSLNAAGIRCEVVAPSRLQRPSGDRVTGRHVSRERPKVSPSRSPMTHSVCSHRCPNAPFGEVLGARLDGGADRTADASLVSGVRLRPGGVVVSQDEMALLNASNEFGCSDIGPTGSARSRHRYEYPIAAGSCCARRSRTHATRTSRQAPTHLPSRRLNGYPPKHLELAQGRRAASGHRLADLSVDASRFDPCRSRCVCARPPVKGKMNGCGPNNNVTRRQS